MPGAIEEQIRSAIRLQQTGRAEEAESIYNAILKDSPEHPEALAMLAAIAAHRRDFDGAIELLRRAVRSNPAFAEAHRNLAAVLVHRGRLEEAQTSLDAAVQADPTGVRAWFDRGNLLLRRGQIEEAIASYSRAIKLKPEFGEAHQNLGSALRKNGRVKEADESAFRASLLTPEATKTFAEIQSMLMDKSKWDDAIVRYLRQIRYESPEVKAGWVAGHPEPVKLDDPDSLAAFRNTRADASATDVHANMAMLLAESYRLDEAMAAYHCAAALWPDAPRTQESIGRILLLRNQSTQAVEHLRKAVAAGPNEASAWATLGLCLRTLGEFDEAGKCFRRMMELRPDLVVGFTFLASVGKLESDRPEIDRLKKVLTSPELSESDRVAAEFALGRVYDKSGLYDEAFAHYASANSLMKIKREKAGEKYDPALVRAQVGRLMEVYSAEYFRGHRDWGVASDLPVFVVGMPRSGTTLVHQIAASHSSVHGVGERPDLHNIAKRLGSVDIAADAVHYERSDVWREAEAHIEFLQSMGPGALRVVDKLPSNLIFLGLAAILFPKSRVILCRRDARDTSLSCYFQWFAEGNSFSYDLAHCGYEHRANDRVAAHWLKVLPLPILEVQYEKLVENLELESRRIIEFIGLPWEPACLEYYKKKNEIHTASDWQARQPIYKDSVGRWRHYEKHLGPLLKALEQA